MTKREKVIEILKKHSVFTCNPPTYHERQFIRPEDLNVRLYNHCELADKILALDQECLGVDEIAKIARICLIEKGFRDNLNSTSKAIAHALAGKIAKPQEPKCTCSIGAISKSMITDKDCPLHGRKVGKIEPTNPFRSKPPERFAEVHYAFCSMADKLDELVEVINKLNGVE